MKSYSRNPIGGLYYLRRRILLHSPFLNLFKKTPSSPQYFHLADEEYNQRATSPLHISFDAQNQIWN